MLHTLLLLCCAFSTDDVPEGWQKVTLPNLGFNVTMPKPTRQATEDKGPDGKLARIQTHRGKDDKLTFVLSVSEFSLQYISQTSQILFDNARNAALLRSGGSLVREVDLMLDKVPFREVIIKAKEAGFIKARVYVFNQRQYSVMLAAPTQEDLETEKANLYFNSFQLVPIKRTGKK